MSKEKLIVKNFGPIKNVELELGKVNVFIGEQAGGKSTLAKLIAIFRDWDFLEKKQSFELMLDRFNILNYLSSSSEIKYKTDEFQIVFENQKIFFDFQKQFELKIKERKELRNHFTHADSVTGYNKFVESYIQIGNLIKPSQYFPAERMLISLLSNSIFLLLENDIALPKFLIRFGSSYQLAKINLKSIYFSEFDIKYEYSNQNDLVVFKKKKLRLTESSSGIQALLPMILVIDYFSSSSSSPYKTSDFTYVIEEPELNLYPSAQKKLMDFLVEKCTKNGNNLVLTTHSPYILTAISNLILAGNTLKNNPELKKEIIKLVPEKYHLAYEDVQAYYVEDGTARSIMSSEYQTIDASPIDDVSNELSEIFDQLLDLKYQKK